MYVSKKEICHIIQESFSVLSQSTFLQELERQICEFCVSSKVCPTVIQFFLCAICAPKHKRFFKRSLASQKLSFLSSSWKVMKRLSMSSLNSVNELFRVWVSSAINDSLPFENSHHTWPSNWYTIVLLHFLKGRS